MSNLDEFYENNQDDIDQMWEEAQIEHYGFDVTEWANWDSCPPDDFVADCMERAKAIAEGEL